MRIGFIGLGKLGLPVAVAINHFGKHEVFGYDISDNVISSLVNKKVNYKEEKLDELLHQSNVNVCRDIKEVVDNSEIVFTAIQTPHEPQYEGITRIPTTKADFNYDFLKEAAKDVSAVNKKIELVIVSTVLPGTMRREIIPLLNSKISLLYNPFFIAMGTTIDDFMNPEFVLIGHDDKDVSLLRDFYKTIHNKPIFETTIETAELIKVGYNTFIGMKIVFANTMMEIAHKTGINCDDISNAFSLATDRLISKKYLKGGMGDGGGCHPRDNIAMSYLAEKLNLSHNIFEDLMKTREDQTEWLAHLLIKKSNETNLPICICGLAYKPDTNLTVGSPSILLENILIELGHKPLKYDPYLDVGNLDNPAVYIIGTMHKCFNDMIFPADSIIFDPWRYLKPKPNVQIISIGNTDANLIANTHQRKTRKY